MVKSGEHENTVWPKEETLPDEAEATENGIYVRLEHSNVYSVSWYFENKSGGMTNADGTSLEAGKNIYLDNDIFSTAANLERPIPIMLTFSDKDGKTIAHANLSYDSKSPVMTVTLCQYRFFRRRQQLVTTLKLEGEGLVDMTFTTDPKDYVQMELTPIV